MIEIKFGVYQIYGANHDMGRQHDPSGPPIPASGVSTIFVDDLNYINKNMNILTFICSP